MNQILVTEKVYVTPDLKRKKRLYKIRANGFPNNIMIINVFKFILLKPAI